MLKFITLPNGERYPWKDVLRLHREQAKADREAQHDSRPALQRTASGRYEEPTLFQVDWRSTQLPRFRGAIHNSALFDSAVSRLEMTQHRCPKFLSLLCRQLA